MLYLAEKGETMKTVSQAKQCLLWIILLLLTGCSAVGLSPVSTKAPTTANEAVQTAINEANATLTAINNTIASNLKEGIFTKAEAQDYLNQSIAYGKRVDRAQEFLNAGDISNAQTQAEVLQSLLLAFQRKVAEKAQTQ